MAINIYAGDYYTGLSTDTKPTGVGAPAAGARWLETDTNTLYVYNGTSWEVTLDVAGMDDVNITSPSTGDFLKYNAGTSDWENGALVLADISDFTDLELNDNTDVVITTPSLDQVLSYDGSDWVNVDLNSIISDIEVLDDLTDVTVTSVATDDILYYNGTQWVNATIPEIANLVADIRGLFSAGGDLSYNSGTGEFSITIAESLDDLTDVVITSAASGDFLYYNGSNWVDAVLDTEISNLGYITGITGENLGDLSDVVITAASAGEVLYYNGSNWVDQALDTDDVAEGTNLYYTDGRVLSAVSGAGYITDITAENIGDLANVDTTGATTGSTLEYNGSTWVVGTDDGLTTVATDATITGDGSGGSPLSVNINDSAAATTNELYSGDYIDASFQRTSEKNSANGYVGLDGNSKIPSTYLPALAITDVFVVADITARDALTVGTGDGEVQEGDVAVVTDASDDADVPSGSASYIYDGTGWQIMGTPDIEAAGANTQVQYNDNGDFGASTKFLFNESSDLLTLQSGFLLKEQATGSPSTPSNVDEAVYFVESDANDTFVKVKMANGNDVIISSYRHTA